MRLALKTKKIIIIAVLIAVLATIGVWYWFNKDKTVEAPQPITLKEAVENISVSGKRVMLFGLEQDNEGLGQATSESLKAWEVFVKTFKDEQPEEYKRTKDWDKKLLQILKHERKADELFKEGKPDQASKELKESEQIYKRIKEENGITDISEEILAMYDEVQAIARAKKKSEIKEDLLSLKLKYTALKEYEFDNNYKKQMANLEEAIATLDKSLDGPDFQQAQKKLEKIFLAIFEDY